MRRIFLRTPWLLAGVIAAGFLFGLVTNYIPATEDPREFWVSNLASPWLAIAFLAGWIQPSWRWAAVSGALADIAAVVGFYTRLLHLTDNSAPELSPVTPLVEKVLFNFGSWLRFTTPWFVIALIAGLAFGLLGYQWGKNRRNIAVVLLALAFIAEPWAWAVYKGYLPHPYQIWIVETCIGFGILVYVFLLNRRYAVHQKRSQNDSLYL